MDNIVLLSITADDLRHIVSTALSEALDQRPAAPAQPHHNQNRMTTSAATRSARCAGRKHEANVAGMLGVDQMVREARKSTADRSGQSHADRRRMPDVDDLWQLEWSATQIDLLMIIDALKQANYLSAATTDEEIIQHFNYGSTSDAPGTIYRMARRKLMHGESIPTREKLDALIDILIKMRDRV